MARDLTATEAQAAFEDIVKGLAKQHLRLRFRRKFGTGELMDAAMLVKGTVAAPSDKPITNLLQEIPEDVTVLRVVGTDGELTGISRSTPATMTIGELLSGDEVEQGLVVTGRKARILAYFDPTEEYVFVARESVEVPYVPKPAAKKSRKKAAGNSAGKARARKR